VAGDPAPVGAAGVVGSDGAAEGVQPGDNGAGDAYGAPGVAAGGAGNPGKAVAAGAAVVGGGYEGVTGTPTAGQPGAVTGAAG